jgi:hypothetical protein
MVLLDGGGGDPRNVVEFHRPEPSAQTLIRPHRRFADTWAGGELLI